MSADIVRFYRDKKDIRTLPPVPMPLRVEAQTSFASMMNDDSLPLFQKLEKAYEFFDRYNAFVSTFAVCSRGCNHCCNGDVQLTRLEAEYIHHKTGESLPIDFNSPLTTGHEEPCAFLSSDGSCGVYAVRPFNCRTFHTLDDPKYCATNEPHQIYGSAREGYGVDVYSSFAVWLGQLHAMTGVKTKDIRDWFPLSTAPKNATS